MFWFSKWRNSAPIVYFFDVGKIKEQTNQKLKFEHLYKTRGLLSTTLRESLAISFYFGPYFVKKNIIWIRL